MAAQHGDHHIIVRTIAGQELVLEDLPARDGVRFELRDPSEPCAREVFILQGDEVAEIGGWLYGWVLAYASRVYDPNTASPHPRIDDPLIDPRHPSQHRDN